MELICRCGRDEWQHEPLPVNNYRPLCRDYRPMDFRPFLGETDSCHCDLCNTLKYAAAMPGREWVAACNVLFDALTAGTHVRREWAEWLEKLEAARPDGGGDE